MVINTNLKKEIYIYIYILVTMEMSQWQILNIQLRYVHIFLWSWGYYIINKHLQATHVYNRNGIIEDTGITFFSLEYHVYIFFWKKNRHDWNYGIFPISMI